MLFARGETALESMVDASNLALFCTPAINLFEKRADRIHVGDESYEYHVVPDRTRPLDFEVYAVTDVVGHGVGSDSEQEFLPAVRGIHATRPIGPVRVLHDAARAAAGVGPPQRRRGRVRATSAARSSCRSSIRPRRRSPATCASCPCGRPARTATCRC